MKRKNIVKLLTLSLLLVMEINIMIIVYSDLQEGTNNEIVNKLPSKRENKILFTDPFQINSNQELINRAKSDSWQGNGTKINPYVMKGFNIKGTEGEDIISIGFVDLYLVITNCSFFEGKRGITVQFSKNIEINDNNIFDCEKDGIRVYQCNKSISIVKNKINGIANGKLHGDGITLIDSSNVSVKENIIWNSRQGIRLDNSNDVDISNNNIKFNTYRSVAVTSSFDVKILENNIDNTGGILIEGEIRLYDQWDSENFIINNNNFTNGGLSFEVQCSSNVKITNNYINNYTFGVKYTNVSIGLISNNTICNVKYHAVKLHDSYDIDMAWNNFIGNRYYIFKREYMEQEKTILKDKDLSQILEENDENKASNINNNYWGDWCYDKEEIDGIISADYPIEGNTENKDKNPLAKPNRLKNHVVSVPRILNPIGYESMQNSVEINWSSSIDYPNDHEVSYSLYYAETTNMEIEGTESWVQITSKLKTNFYEWDTSVLDSGWYHIKVVSECDKGMKVSDTSDSAFSIGIDRARNQMIGEYGGIIPGITILISTITIIGLVFYKKVKKRF